MVDRLDVCIRGDGIVGHALALLLARERLRVGLVGAPQGRASSHPDVRAYALNHASRSLLEDLRCWPEPRHATPVLGMQVQEAGAGRVGFSAVEQGEPALAWIVDVPALEARLTDAIGYQGSIRWLSEPAPAPLTAICEGRASAARTALDAGWRAADYGQWAIAGRVRAERAHEQVASQWFTPQEVLGMLPLSEPDGNSLAFVWSIPAQRRTELLQASAEVFVEALQQACGTHFGELDLIGERAAWPLQLATAQRWVGRGSGGAWALLGDAAHLVHPLSGQGLNLGLGDAVELAAQLAAREPWRGLDDLRPLRRYERARKAEVWLLGSTTDALQQVFSRSGAAWRGLRQWGMGGFDQSGPFKRWVAARAMGMTHRGGGLVHDGEGAA